MVRAGCRVEVVGNKQDKTTGRRSRQEHTGKQANNEKLHGQRLSTSKNHGENNRGRESKHGCRHEKFEYKTDLENCGGGGEVTKNGAAVLKRKFVICITEKLPC